MWSMRIRSYIWGILGAVAVALVVGEASSDQVAGRQAFKTGRQAYDIGDYSAAARIWSPLAQAGDPSAQASLALMYAIGQGVPADVSRANDLARAAADANDPQGQLLLGSFFLSGKGIKQSNMMAFIWCDLALKNGNADATECRETALRNLTETEVKLAYGLVSQWRGQRQASTLR